MRLPMATRWRFRLWSGSRADLQANLHADLHADLIDGMGATALERSRALAPREAWWTLMPRGQSGLHERALVDGGLRSLLDRVLDEGGPSSRGGGLERALEAALRAGRLLLVPVAATVASVSEPEEQRSVAPPPLEEDDALAWMTIADVEEPDGFDCKVDVEEPDAFDSAVEIEEPAGFDVAIAVTVAHGQGEGAGPAETPAAAN